MVSLFAAFKIGGAEVSHTYMLQTSPGDRVV